MSEASASPTSDTTGDLPARVSALRAAFDDGRTRSLPWRVRQLDGLARFLRERSDALADALASDLGKARSEAWMTEIGFAAGDLAYVRRHLHRWMRRRRVRTPLTAQPARSAIVAEPKGVVLIIGPWNYPVQLTITPLVAALAAGNTAVVKPSELAPATSRVLAELLGRYVDDDAVAVVEGGVEPTTALLRERFDHIFYTGGARVATIVMRAAAEHLTPVTLELGGKSPAIVDRNSDLKLAARQIAWGKFLNAGQTCIAPDYVLVQRDVRERLVEHLRDSVRGFYGADPERSDSYARIIDQRHFDRLTNALASASASGGARIAIGGTSDATTRYIAPTVLTDVAGGSPLLTEEIFGPILPVVAVDDIAEAVDYVNARPKPLALYVFSDDRATVERVIGATSSGGVTVNGTLLHVSSPHLPFGGVGASGFGAYHGRFGFDTFSHHKPVLQRRTWPDLPVAHPPYRRWKDWIVRRVM